MFTGIIESLAQVKEKIVSGTNVDFKIEAEITPELKVDQSVAHNGVCLTVTKIEGSTYWVTAVEETLKKTNEVNDSSVEIVTRFLLIITLIQVGLLLLESVLRRSSNNALCSGASSAKAVFSCGWLTRP